VVCWEDHESLDDGDMYDVTAVDLIADYLLGDLIFI
jgi:hypothetical protein